MFRFLTFTLLILVHSSCQQHHDGINELQFKSLMTNIAKGWSTQNTDLALSSFHPDAIYMQPPNVQFYKGHAQLRPYFDELTEEHKMKFHNLWFDPSSQMGAGEFTFSYGKATADIGVAIVRISDGKIDFWREYLKKGPTDFDEFIGIENKQWEWHIGNYPVPKDSSLISD